MTFTSLQFRNYLLTNGPTLFRLRNSVSARDVMRSSSAVWSESNYSLFCNSKFVRIFNFSTNFQSFCSQFLCVCFSYSYLVSHIVYQIFVAEHLLLSNISPAIVASLNSKSCALGYVFERWGNLFIPLTQSQIRRFEYGTT